MSMMKAPKKRKERSSLLDRVLFGCSSICFHVVKRFEKADPKLFRHTALNRVILFKYPNYALSPSVETTNAAVAEEVRPVETAIFVPYDSQQLDLGGHGIYLRQRNYQDLMLRHLGIDLKSTDPDTLHDLQILEEIDRIPSLDPFLLKTHLTRLDPKIDPTYFDITDEELAATRAVIASKVQPIIERALVDVDANQRREHTNKFLAALWDPTLPEAALFIKAFGIQTESSAQIFDALKGISFYQWNIVGNREPLQLAMKWLQSENAIPYDMRQHMHHKESFDMFRNKVANGIKDVGRIANSVFLEFDSAHASFLKNGDPKPFRMFLESIHKRYWMLGYSSAAISQITFLFNNAMLEAQRGRLGFERMLEMLTLMSLSMMDKGSGNAEPRGDEI